MLRRASLLATALGVVMFATSLFNSPVARASTDSQVASLRSQVADASAEEAQLLDALDAANAQVAKLSDQVAALDADIVDARRERDAAQAHLDDLEVRYNQARSKYEAAVDALRAARDELKAKAVAAYTGGPLVAGYADALLNGGVGELAARSGYLSTLVEERKRAVDRFRSLSEETRDLARSLEQSRTAALAERELVAQRTSRLEQARTQQDAVRAEAIAQSERRENVLASVRARKAEFEAEITALQQQSDAVSADLRDRQAGQGLQPSGHGVLAVPIPGAPITSTFGPRVHPVYGDVRVHTGIDFGADYGTPIHASADGVVVSAGPLGGYGNATIIDHGNHLATLYAHQSTIVVKAGSRVTRGQVIGYVGATGTATGPHLHFEVRVDGTPVDPMGYL